MEILKNFKQNLMKELADTDFSQVYEDMDILSCVKSYNEIQAKLDDINTPKDEKTKLQKEINKIEKECLAKNKLVKLIGEDKSYYCYKNKVYDTNGTLIEYDFDIALDDNDLFCEYIGDNLYETMRKLAVKNLKKYASENEDY